jgi:hypothetical protein
VKCFKNKIFFLFLLPLALGGGFIYFLSHSHQYDIPKLLKTIPCEEKWLLDYFFHDILFHQNGAYVLNGCKPASLENFEPPSLNTIFFFGNRFFKREVLLKRGLETWKKHQHLFPSNSHLLICHLDKNNQFYELLLINKHTLLHEIEENINDFRRALGAKMTAEDILHQIENNERSLIELLDHRSDLLGILLGFGRHNYYLFYHREMLQHKIEKCQFVPKRLEYVQQEIDAISHRFQSVVQKKRNSLHLFSFPKFFFELGHPETDKVLSQYKQRAKEIPPLFLHGNFLESYLRQFTS